MPTGYKLCSFNCVYCHYGWTRVRTRDVSRFLKDLPEYDDVINALTGALNSQEPFDYITFSGNGEPTLYPRFASLAAELARLRDRYRPDAKIALLSNSTGLTDLAVQQSIVHIDLPVFKLDAGTEQTFCAINRPDPGLDFDEIMNQLAGLRDIYIQTVLVQGTPGNVAAQELDVYFERIRAIKPRAVHVYSIDRPVPNTKLKRVLPRRLEQIAALAREKTGAAVQAFHMG
jgi:wyosine [tRNA(Phe)-imidazoG37] synthetase (radical SAM superfamily)